MSKRGIRMNKEQIVYKKTSELKLNDKNPRKNDEAVDTVAKSIQEFGFKNPLIIDSDGTVWCGNTRLKAARKLGIEEVPCIVADDLTEEQIRKLALIDNKSSEIAEWDFELLKDELADLDMDEFDLDWGIDEALGIEKEVEEDNFDVDEAIPDEPKAKLGDIYQLGEHRIMCGSSTNPEDMGKLFDGKIADLVVTDPPYNVNYGDKAEMLGDYEKGHRNTNKILNDNMDDLSFYNFLYDFYTQMNDHMKEGGAFYVFHSDSESLNFRKALKDVGLQVRQTLIWVKNTLVLGRKDYQLKHEPCLYGWKDGAGHYFTDDRTETTVIEDKIDLKKLKKEEMLKLLEEIYSDKVSTTIIHEDKPLRNDLHPTMKPIKLCAKLIKNSSKPKQIVFDGFGGSGSTMMACEQTDRICYSMELDPKYIDVQIKRWEDFTGKKAEKLN